MAKIARIFRDQVRAARGRRGLTQVQLADLVGVSEQWIRKIDAGESSPSFDTIEALARALQTPVGDLFEAGKESPLAKAIDVAAPPAPVSWPGRDRVSRRRAALRRRSARPCWAAGSPGLG